MEEQWEMEQQCEMLEEKCYKLNNCLYTAGCHVTPAQQEKHPDWLSWHGTTVRDGTTVWNARREMLEIKQLYTAGCHVTPAQQEKHPD